MTKFLKSGRVKEADIMRTVYCQCERPNWYKDVTPAPMGHVTQVTKRCLKCGRRCRAPS